MVFLDAIAPYPLFLGFASLGFIVILMAIAALVVTTMVIIALYQKFSKKKDKEKPSE